MLNLSTNSFSESKYLKYFVEVSIFTELLLSRFVECASDSLFATLSKSNGELSAFTKVVNTRHFPKFVVHSSVSVCGQSAVHFTNSYRPSVAHALPPTWWRLHAGGGIGKARTRANDAVTCSVSYESAPPLAWNRSLGAGFFLFSFIFTIFFVVCLLSSVYLSILNILPFAKSSELKSPEYFAKLSKYTKSSRPKILLSACTQRGGGFTQAGVSVRLGREQKMQLPALCQTSIHPRLRETAR